MNDLKIEGTEDSPTVNLSKTSGEILISGRSLPEDAFSFYAPVMEWLGDYVKSPNTDTVFNFKLEYFNTASAKQIFKIVGMANDLAKGSKVTIKWFYDEGDRDMLSSGERFSKLTQLPFEYIQN
ncbi:MAG: hypothetical protein K0S32_4139 [Bacteroidetes bacterium]|jgi:hypothetical protein|nr:hypothetical protein [Bacteroidota bacterium]